MIGVCLEGRMGNQMFQYAFGLNLSKVLQTSFFMDKEKIPFLLPQFFELGSYDKRRAKRARLCYNMLNYLGKTKFIDDDYHDAFNTDNSFAKSNRCLYRGFFQSEIFFQEHAQLIKQEFKIKPQFKIDVRSLLNVDSRPLVVLHVRRTDYVEWGSDSLGGKNLSLPLEYYHTCLKRIDGLEDYNVVFVTDDAEYVAEKFREYNPIISSNSNPIIDFQILLAADVLAVANSSFSWWGAYLNESCKKKFAPKYWLGFKVKREYPNKVVASGWEEIEI